MSSEKKNPRRLDDWLSAQSACTLATVNTDGTPFACDLFYAHSESLTLYFLSDPKTLHVQNLTRESRVSATIHGGARGWQEIQGVQMVGTAQRVEEAGERLRGYRLYLAKFVFVGQWLPTIRSLGQAHAQLGVVELYKLEPRWVRWIDNTQGFGHKEEFQI
jgi:uncharacterized protein YhbP (UPF0306 family)